MKAFVIACVALAGGCTRKNPIYCEGPADCESGVCDIARNTCVESIDGAPIDARPDARDECSVAQGRVVFETDRDGDLEVAVAYADGSGLRILTDNLVEDREPRWSPDGSKIAWLSAPNGVPEVLVMNADGSGALNVSRPSGLPGPCSEVSWSPDSSRLMFRIMDGGNSEIYSVAADGTGLTNLTNQPSVDHGGAWSADGSRVVFSSDRDDPQLDVYVMNADGTGVTRLTSNPERDYDPIWSPNGSRIAFITVRPTYRDLFTMDPLGNDEQLLASGNTGAILDHEYSSDGGAVAFTRSGDIWMIRADGSGLINLTSTASAQESEAHWAPDGTRIIFTSDRTGDDEVYSVRTDGTELTNLTNSPAGERAGGWTTCR